MTVSELRRLAEQEEPWWAADYEVLRNSLPALLDCVEAANHWVACSIEQMRQETGKGHCPHTILFGGDQEESCFKRTLDALAALDGEQT